MHTGITKASMRSTQHQYGGLTSFHHVIITSNKYLSLLFVCCILNDTCNCFSSRRSCRDHSVYVLSQWETALHCNAVSHWLGAYTEWSLVTLTCHNWFYKDTGKPLYNTILLLKNTHNRHSIARPWGEVWSVFCVFIVGSAFYNCNFML